MLKRSRVKVQTPVPVNTIDEALASARVVLRDLRSEGSKASQRYRIFSALTSDKREGFAAFLLWQARGETIRQLTAS